MIRRSWIVSVCMLALGALGMPGLVGAASADATDLVFEEGLCGQDGARCRFVRDGRPGTMGDTLVFSLPSRDVAGEVVGRDEGECYELHRAAERSVCDFVVHLPDGDLVVEGTFANSFEVSSIAAVLGGTGAYAAATGTWSQQGQDVSVHLVTP